MFFKGSTFILKNKKMGLFQSAGGMVSEKSWCAKKIVFPNSF